MQWKINLQKSFFKGGGRGQANEHFVLLRIDILKECEMLLCSSGKNNSDISAWSMENKIKKKNLFACFETQEKHFYKISFSHFKF